MHVQLAMSERGVNHTLDGSLSASQRENLGQTDTLRSTQGNNLTIPTPVGYHGVEASCDSEHR